MRRLLSLLVQHVIVGIPDQWPVVGMEEHLVCYLKSDEHLLTCIKLRLLYTFSEDVRMIR